VSSGVGSAGSALQGKNVVSQLSGKKTATSTIGIIPGLLTVMIFGLGLRKAFGARRESLL